jgi:hypothetical protein
MDKFLDMYDLPKLNQEDTNNLNTFIISNKTEAQPRVSPKKRTPGQDGFIAEFYQTNAPPKSFH